MSESSSTNDITSKITQIVHTNGIEGMISDVVVKDAGLQGEGFGGKTLCVTVKFQDPCVKQLNLFVKMVSNNEAHTERMDEGKTFEKEARFLTEYVPAAKKMWKMKRHEEQFDIYPKCYYGDSRMIVMENLVVDHGYCLLDKKERQDIETAKFALRTLAKHHAISYAMIEEEGGPESFFKRFLHLDLDGIVKPQFAEIMGPMFSNTLKSNIGLLENNDVDGREDALAFLKGFQNLSLVELIVNSVQCEKDSLMVLNHGDYWNNNMMFLKDEETDRIIAHKAIDFQVTRYNSPALDLTYYLFSSVKTDVRVTYLKELLELYFDTVKSISNDLGHPINWTYKQLLQQYKKRIDFGFWFAMCIVIGPGLEVMKDVDINTVDVKDWANLFNDRMKEWIDANPAYSKVIADDIVKLCREYKTLAQLELN